MVAVVSQGSILGPFPWNIMYDEVSNLCVLEKVTLNGLTSDLVMVSVVNQTEDVGIYGN